MSWKKNAFSYLIWFVYTVLIGVGLMGVADFLCTEMGLAFYWGAAFVFLYGLLVWGMVLFLRRFARAHLADADRKREHLLVLEGLALLLLLGAGIALRAGGVEGAAQSSVYYEMARVAAGQKIPQTVHGAVYFYVQMLHAVFGLLGNHFQAGLWFQIVLQIGAMAALYFTLRRLAGTVAALVTFGFGMCAPYMVQSALVLSPDMLYFLLLAVSGAALAALGGEKETAGGRSFGSEASGEGKGRRRADRTSGGLRLPAFFLMGIVAAVCCYMDIMGLALLFAALAMVFCRRKAVPGPGRKAAAAAVCVLGAILGFGACVLADAFLSGKTVAGVAQAWLRLYEPGGFRLPVVMEEAGADAVRSVLPAGGTWPVLSSGSGAEGALLLALMAFGVFSFWCDRRNERISVCVLTAGGIALASCYGIFTEEMPGFFVLYLLFALLAGLGLGQCFHVPYGAEAGKEAAAEIDDEEEADGGATVLPDAEGSGDSLGHRRRTRHQADGAEDSQSPQGAAEEAGQREVRYLENPMPLPKKHVKRVLDYGLKSTAEDDDFDFSVAEDDDFDI